MRDSQAPKSPAPRGIVLFAHGSRDPRWSAPIEAIARRMRQLDPAARIACAYLEFTPPGLPEACARLIAEGAASLTVWPMFLGMGRHAREDLPRLLTAARHAHPGVPITQAAPIAEHPAVLEALACAALMEMPTGDSAG